jgi:hypothetical protein
MASRAVFLFWSGGELSLRMAGGLLCNVTFCDTGFCKPSSPTLEAVGLTADAAADVE